MFIVRVEESKYKNAPCWCFLSAEKIVISEHPVSRKEGTEHPTLKEFYFDFLPERFPKVDTEIIGRDEEEWANESACIRVIELHDGNTLRLACAQDCEVYVMNANGKTIERYVRV